MREILFRGKRPDIGGQWLEGDLVHTTTAKIPRIRIHSGNNSAISYLVIPETVGQYTGLKDKNGKRIFEGDIVMFLDYTEPAFIVWDQEDARWFMRYSDCMLDFSYKCVPSALEVIGNIHDNPELIAEVEG